MMLNISRAYQAVADDDTTAGLTNSLGSLLTSWSPNRAFASKQVDVPRELFKDQYGLLTASSLLANETA